MSDNDTCPNCGGDILGDGYRSPLICENAIEDERAECREPDAPPLYCKPEQPTPSQHEQHDRP